VLHPVNHLGQFALTAQLLAPLLQSPAAHLVSVTAPAGAPVAPQPGQPPPQRRAGAAVPRRRVPARSIGVHPGFTNTDLQARSVRETGGGRSQRFFSTAVRRFGMTPARSALPLLRAATDPGAIGGALHTPRW
jgi:NAD(P)-dependent dehydrogenase (short-subunit alcohol dehydrogenase family)